MEILIETLNFRYAEDAWKFKILSEFSMYFNVSRSVIEEIYVLELYPNKNKSYIKSIMKDSDADGFDTLSFKYY